MSIEQKVESLISAIEANTAAILKSGISASAVIEKIEEPKQRGRPKGNGATKPARSQEEMVAALTKLKDAQGAAVAKEVIKAVGGVEKMADVPAERFEAVYAAACAKFDELAAANGEDEDGI